MLHKRSTKLVLSVLAILMAALFTGCQTTDETPAPTAMPPVEFTATPSPLPPTEKLMSVENQVATVVAATMAAQVEKENGSPTAAIIPDPAIPSVATAVLDGDSATWGPINQVWFYNQPVPMTLVNQMLADNDKVSEMLVAINAATMIDSLSAIGGEWGAKEAATGFNLPGSTVFWTDLLGEEGIRPACLEPLRVQGEWGVFYLPTGCEFTVPAINGGGRWISVVDHELINEIYAETQPRTPQEAMATVIEYWDDEYSLNFESGGTLTLKEGEVAIVWTDWKGAPPELAFSWNADYGYGVFLLAGPGTWEVPSGGAHVFELATQ